MAVPQIKLSATAILVVGTLGIAGYVVWNWLHSDAGKGTLQWWQNTLGQLPPGTQIADTTGSAGTTATQAAFAGVVNNHSQGFYNACLQQYSYDQGNGGALDAQGGPGWPWTSFDNWAAMNYPPLPSMASVTVDSNGVYHNDYI